MNSSPHTVTSRHPAFPIVLATLAMFSLVFFYQQNFRGQIGGPISVAKLLWLDYTITAWFILPFFLSRSCLLAPAVRRIYRLHLINFLTRGAAELWMLYVTISWSPLYGIVHDGFSVLLITGLLWSRRDELHPLVSPGNLAALRFLLSLRLGFICEAVFAALFYRATGGEPGLYFAAPDPTFDFINGVTWSVLLFAYPDLLRTIWVLRDAFLSTPLIFPWRKGSHAW